MLKIVVFLTLKQFYWCFLAVKKTPVFWLYEIDPSSKIAVWCTRLVKTSFKIAVGCCLSNQGWDSPRLKLCYPSFWLSHYKKEGKVKQGESRPSLTILQFWIVKITNKKCLEIIETIIIKITWGEGEGCWGFMDCN